MAIKQNCKDLIKSFHLKLWGFKNFETQIGHFCKSGNIFNMYFSWTNKIDHAGFEAGVLFMGYHILFTFYDSRHWNDKLNQWESLDCTKMPKSKRQVKTKKGK